MANKHQKLTPLQLEEILCDHDEWLSSNFKSGKSAELAGQNLEGFDLSGKNLSFSNLKGAKLQGANLIGTNFQKAVLSRADLSNAKLSHALLQKSVLSYANFSNTNLEDAKLEDADLKSTDLSKTTGLIAKQLAGTNLTGVILPDSINVVEPLNEIGDLAKSAKVIFIAVILACFYSWLTIGATNDVSLLTNSIPAKLPLLGVEMPIAIFYFVGPVILLATFLYLHLYLQRLWEKLAAMPSIFQDGRTLDERVYPWIFVGFARSHLFRLSTHRPAFSRLQSCLCISLAYALVPFTIYIFWGGYLTKQFLLCSEIHVFEIAVIIFCALRFYIIAIKTLRRRHVTWFDRIFSAGIALLIGYFLHFLSWNSINCERHDSVATSIRLTLPKGDSPYAKKDLATSDPRFWVPTLLAKSLINSFADLTEADVSLKPSNWSGDPAQLPFVKGADLHLASLHNATAPNVFLVNANMQGVNLSGALLYNASLQGANLSQANMCWTVLQCAQLQGVKLDFTFILGASLWQANLKGAKGNWTSFEGSSCLSADFSDTVLENSSFGSTGLMGVNFTNAILKNSRFQKANLTLAKMQRTDCMRADFAEANLAGADFSEANLAFANLKDIQGWTNISSLKLANIYSVQNAPEGFIEWATNKMGAITTKKTDEWTPD